MNKQHEAESRRALPHGSKPHPWHGHFAASPDGRLWRISPNGARWKEVRKEVLWMDKKTVRILAVVLECFIPKPGPKYKLGFRDGDRSNKKAKNLFWVPIGCPDDLRKMVQDRVARGERRQDVAQNLQVPYRTVCKWAEDLPSLRCRYDIAPDRKEVHASDGSSVLSA
jgi:hypothetical protein